MKIIFLVSSFGSGGAERVASTLCNTWASRGDEVTLVQTYSGVCEPFYQLNREVQSLNLNRLVGEAASNSKQYLARLKALRYLIRQKKPDVVISFLPNVNIASLIATSFTGVPCIICERSDPSMPPLEKSWRIACQLLYRFADVVCVQTDSASGSIRKIYPGLKRTIVIPNPLPSELLQWKANVQQRLSRRSLISIGRLSTEKRVEKIIDVFAELAPKYPIWDLHIYGDGPLRAELLNHINKLALQDRVLLWGSTREPWKVMAHADAFVMASLYEGFPNAMLEAMGVGLACVATDCPSGPRELSRDGVDALLVGVNDQRGLRDALSRLMSNEELRLNLGQRARSSVEERYSIENVLAQWDKVFTALRNVG